MKMPDDYQIPDDPDSGRMDAAYLRTCLGIPTPLVGKPLEFPLPVLRAHFFMAHALSKLGAMGPTGMNATQVAAVVSMASMLGLEVPEQAKPERNFLDDINEGLVDHGAKVVVRYRKNDRPGHFLRVENDKIVVLHDGEERRFQSTSVRLPKTEEFPDVAENIAEAASA